jgi:hypothetical protein
MPRNKIFNPLLFPDKIRILQANMYEIEKKVMNDRKVFLFFMSF